MSDAKEKMNKCSHINSKIESVNICSCVPRKPLHTIIICDDCGRQYNYHGEMKSFDEKDDSLFKHEKPMEDK